MMFIVLQLFSDEDDSDCNNDDDENHRQTYFSIANSLSSANDHGFPFSGGRSRCAGMS
jgi:hypothetical protein